MKQLLVVNIGTTKYADAWELQKRIFEARLKQHIGDIFLFTEHEHVFTLGKAADENHLLASDEELAQKKVDLFWIDRGGDVTYHGPGQIVGYPILDLTSHYQDIHRYLRELEEMIIRTLNDYGISAGREPEFTGVWVKNEKIAALGVKVSRWITMHGFAFNINTDLQYFDRIIPCGIFHKGVTSLQRLLEIEIPLNEVQERLIYHFAKIFSYEIKQISRDELSTYLHTHEVVEEET